MPAKSYERQRYINFAYFGPKKISDKTLWKVVSTNLLRLFGEQGAALTGLYLIEHNVEEQQLIFRATNLTLPMVRAAICSITEIDREPVLLFVTHVSGTIKRTKMKVKPIKDKIETIFTD